MEYREAKPSEAAVLSGLAMRAKAHWQYPDAWMALWKKDLTLTAGYLADRRALVAEDNGEIVGMCVLDDCGPCWSLEHVWIDPQRHRQGIGRTLVERMVAHARRLAPKAIQVHSDPHAEPFYVKLGARRVGSYPAPMPGAPDRVLPVLEF